MPRHDDAELPLPLRRCARGELPANVALMQTASACASREEVEDILTRALAAFAGAGGRAEWQRLSAARDLWAGTPQAWQTIQTILATVGRGPGGIADWTRAFDAAAATAPEAGVALYALGRADLLDAATAEVVERMHRWGLLGRSRTALEIGCGIGRFLPALAPQMRLVVGLDISAGMLREAHRRSAALQGVCLLQGCGRDLAAFQDESFDLVYAIDSFPYLVAAGGDIVRRHILDAYRLLKPGGCLLVMNYSYRGDPGRDRAELAELASIAGFATVQWQDGGGLRYWDAEIVRLIR